MVCKLNSLPPSCRFTNNKLFAGIPTDILNEIGEEMELLQYDPGDIVFHEGDMGDRMFLVGDGRVRISKCGRGGLQETLSFIEPGSFFGEMSLLDGQPRSAQATAAVPTILGGVDEAALKRILESAPSELHLNFLRAVVSRLRGVNERYISEMMRTERMGMVGTMANSIIHDLNNPMSVIQCCASLMAIETDNPALRSYIDVIQESLTGMVAMTQELLDYSRGQTSVEFQQLPLASVLDPLERQVTRLLPKRIAFVKQIECNPTLRIDPCRFPRALMNLIKNGMESMRNPGELRLAVRPVESRVEIAVSDTGCGIPPELQATIFEPFVTSGKSHGTGLGLAIVKTIIEAHGGTISMHSTPGVGTTFTILLPECGK
jgi:signal transduction histidine kinase